ncbi:Oxidoreductase UcpA [BD1-7 clade bacterium]|uniref:Oxidoreductase UcpA n=1 Tax=BD1-7 clade bacterium TaxID=2029982 RepID=A0A5S9R1L9_9GAMM|nr:Oxidoreductase UcpA [BD1-7 clade bacterium]
MTSGNTALITGASGGIGLELAKIHAAKGGDLVLVARSQDKLEALKQTLESTHKIKATVLPEDLTSPGAAQRVFEKTQQLGLQIDVLINNAGIGGLGHFHQQKLADSTQIIDLNIRVLTELTHLYLEGMVQRRHGKVLNVSSTASMLPGPIQAVYYATKAYVTSFSLSLAEELSEFGVTVTALCPGPVHTGFADTANMQGLSVMKVAHKADSVAAKGYRAMERGKLVCINDRILQFSLEWMVPLLPRKLVLKMSRLLMEA